MSRRHLSSGLPTLLRRRRPGVLELGIGEPDPTLLPSRQVRLAAGLVLDELGVEALSYGAPRGPGRLVSWLAAWLSAREGRPLEANRLMLTGGSSTALDQVCTMLTRPGSIALCESPTYHLAAQIFRDHDLEPQGLPIDEDGIVPDALAERIDEIEAAGDCVALVYTVPTHSNPTGRTTPPDRRAELVAVTGERAVLLVEDDPYREIAFEAAPARLPDVGLEPNVIRLGSFSKLLAPGLRLGWLIGDPERVEKLLAAGSLDSGGGPNHFTAMVVERIAASGDLDAHLALLRPAYAERAEALVGELRRLLPEGFRIEQPTGGFFTWVTLPARLDAADLLPRAERLGVSFTPGVRFGVTRGAQPRNALRLSFSGYPPADLREGARRLARAVEG